MADIQPTEQATRRQFLHNSAVAAAALGTMAFPQVAHAGGSDILRVGLVGCGGRGTAAAIDALSADPHTELVAIGDTFADRSASCLQALNDTKEIADRVKVTNESTFSGFDAYKNVIDSDIDVVLLATPPHFRPQQFAYAIDKGKHCFVEKPVAVDVPGAMSVQKTCEEAQKEEPSSRFGVVLALRLGGV